MTDTKHAPEPVTQDERYRHKKRGTEYTLIGVGRAQGTLHDEDPVVLYRGDDGGLWVRHQVEFCDGRFERVEARTTPAPSLEYARGFEAGLHDLKALTAEEDAYPADSELADIERAREIAAKAYAESDCHFTSEKILSGQRDNIAAVRATLLALRQALANKDQDK